MDIDDKYSPFYFARDYGETPIESRPGWIRRVSAVNMAGCGDVSLELLGKPAITAPNGYGKTVLLTLSWALYDLVSTGRPTVLYGMLRNPDGSCSRLFDKFSMVLADGSAYSLSIVGDSYMLSGTGGESLVEASAVSDGNPPSTEVRGGCVAMLSSTRGNRPGDIVYGLLSLSEGDFDRKFINRWYSILFSCTEPDAPESEWDMKMDGIPYERSVARGEMSARLTRWIGERRFSFGEMQMLFQLSAMSGKLDVLLVDNAEIGLHPSVQMNYMALLAECYRRGTQVIFSTNSPEMFDCKWRYSNDLWSLTHPSSVH